MTADDHLYLYEEIMLLALRDKEGTISSGVMYQHAIAGAILAELLLDNHITLDKTSKRKLIDVTAAARVGDPLLDECLEKVRSKRRASMQTWISRFSGIKDLKHRVAGQLCLSRKIYPEVNPEPERRLVNRLRNAIFTDTEELDPRTVVLVSLAHNTELLKATFDKKELKSRKKRIKQIVDGEITGKAAKEAIDAMHAAVMVSCIMPAIVATSVAS